jgi:N-acetylmuramoyl-L-alanine amidase
MIAAAYYLSKLILCSGLLFLYYQLALKNKLFHVWNRFYLLGAVVLSLLIPMWQLPLIHVEEKSAKAIQLLTVIQSADVYLEEAYREKQPFLSAGQWIGLGYGLISAAGLVMLLLSIKKINLLIKKHRIQRLDNVRILSTNEPGTPFSFLNYIFWNEKIDLHSESGQQILLHELTHVKERHTWDKLFLYLILILFWINPFFWLIRREIAMIHEFTADKKALRQGNGPSLASMILQISFPQHYHSITNPFYQSSIKRRILMLTKMHQPRLHYVSRILALPFIAVVILAFGFRMKTKTTVPLVKPITVVIDAGHGKTATGEVSGVRVNDVYEDEIVLALSKIIKEINANKMIRVEFTRPSDELVDLSTRVSIAREKKSDLFISLHVAAAEEGTSDTGIEVYVSSKNTPYQKGSELLGSVLKEELSSVYRTNPELIKGKTGIWVLDRNICPSVLIECGYLTNEKDRLFITNELNQKLVAEKIISAIERYAATIAKNS